MKVSLSRRLIMGMLLSTSATMAHADIVASSGKPINFVGCYPFQTLYFSYNEAHTKAVELCRIGDYYRYTFGPIEKPELQVWKDNTEVGWYESNRSLGFAMKNGNYFYRLKTTRDWRTGIFVSLVVTKGALHGKEIADIPLGNDYYGFQYGIGKGLLDPFPLK